MNSQSQGLVTGWQLWGETCNNSPPQRDKAGENNLIKELFTIEFLSSLKSEISQRVKPSKSILEALKHANMLAQNYKKQIQTLQKTIATLTTQNKNLRQTIINTSQKESYPSINILVPKMLKNLKIQSFEIATLQGEKQSCENLEIQMLIQKVRHLQEYKNVKESRFQEIVERQAQHVGEIDMLRYKNELLQSQIQQLQVSQLKKGDEQLERKRSHSSEQFNQYINHSDICPQQTEDEPTYKPLVRQNRNSLLINDNHDRSLMISCTQAVQIEEEYDLSRPLPTSSNAQFNEIDYILEEELPYTRTHSLLGDSISRPHRQINTSMVVIDLNSSTRELAPGT